MLHAISLVKMIRSNSLTLILPLKIKAHHALIFSPLPDDEILDWSKLKAFADDILKCI